MISLNELDEHYPSLAKIIKTYYPVGIAKDDPKYFDYSGIKKLEQLIHENIVIQNAYENNWTKGFLEIMSNKISKKVFGATIGITPNFGGIIPLDIKDDENSFFQLHFYVSLLENIFYIYIAKLCNSYFKENSHLGHDLRVKTLIVSPNSSIFDNIFMKTENIIKEHFVNAKFLPYCVGNLNLEGLSVLTSDASNCKLKKAFVHEALPLNKDFKIIGNKEYGLKHL